MFSKFAYRPLHRVLDISWLLNEARREKGHLGIYYNKITLPETLKCHYLSNTIIEKIYALQRIMS